MVAIPFLLQGPAASSRCCDRCQAFKFMHIAVFRPESQEKGCHGGFHGESTYLGNLGEFPLLDLHQFLGIDPPITNPTKLPQPASVAWKKLQGSPLLAMAEVLRGGQVRTSSHLIVITSKNPGGVSHNFKTPFVDDCWVAIPKTKRLWLTENVVVARVSAMVLNKVEPQPCFAQNAGQ